MRVKRTLQGAAAIVTLVTAGTTAAGFHFYKMAVSRSRKEFLENNRDLVDNREQAPTAKPANWVESHGYEVVSIESFDGLKLCGYYVPAAMPTTKTVILAHGYTSNGKQMAGFAKYYHEQLGMNVLMPDARGHGESEGNYIGFGWHDRLDYLRWIDFLVQRLGEQVQIVLHGISMGAATVLMTAGEQLPPQVRAVVSDCAYSSAYEQLAYQMKRMYKLPSFPVLWATSLVTKARAGYSIGQATAVDQVRKAEVPILFIHGDADAFVPFRMAQQLYDACQSEKQLLVVPGAGHGLAYRRDRVRYEQVVTDFLGAYLEPDAGY